MASPESHRALFVDTAGWLCHLDRDQPAHAQASQLIQRALESGIPLITTNYVVAELTALLTARTRLPRASVLGAIETTRRSPSVEIAFVDPELDEAAWAMLRSRLDKDWSLVDAVSFIVMQRRGLQEAVTTDHHFEQAGFSSLLA